MIRQDSLACGMPPHIYKELADGMVELMTGYCDEKRWIAKNTPPPMPVFTLLRQITSGGILYVKYVALMEYRTLPMDVLRHPVILRLQDLASSMIGHHNDFISLPKELARKGEVMNVAVAVQAEFKLGLKEAYLKAMEIHDADLAEFRLLQNNLPDFGEWQCLVEEYVADLGVMLRGVYDWHIIKTGRYVEGGYVEPEFESKEFF